MQYKKDIIIIYHSFHHKNTEKIVQELSKNFAIKSVKINAAKKEDFETGHIIFASGVYFAKPHRLFYEKVPNLNKPKEVLLITTSGIPNFPLFNSYRKKFSQFFFNRGYIIRDWFETRGFDTYPAISKPFGGFSKGRPDSIDIERAINWLTKLL